MKVSHVLTFVLCKFSVVVNGFAFGFAFLLPKSLEERTDSLQLASQASSDNDQESESESDGTSSRSFSRSRRNVLFSLPLSTAAAAFGRSQPAPAKPINTIMGKLTPLPDPSTRFKRRSKIPAVGFGTFNSFKEPEKVYESVKFAIKIGYRLFDCASLYGNEVEVGRAINECIESGDVRREDLCIMSKLWNTEHDPQDVEPACRRSLDAMGLDYFDIYMMHWPVHMEKESKLISSNDGGEFEFKIIHSGNRKNLAKTYEAMEALVHKGLVADLGVSNFSSRQLAELLADCSIPPVANEVERHPLLQQPPLFDYCREHDIHVIGFSPLGKIGYRNPGAPDMLAVPEIAKIAEETGRTRAQVVLGWAVQSGSSVIPKSLTPSRIAENFDVQSSFLSIEQMDALNKVDQGYRFVSVPYYDFPDDDIDLS